MTRRTEDSLPEPSVDCDASSRLEKNSVDVPHNVSVATLLEKKSRRSLESTASSICFSVDASSSSSTFAGRLSTETRWTASTASVAVVDSHTDLKAPQAPVTFLELLLAHIGYACSCYHKLSSHPTLQSRASFVSCNNRRGAYTLRRATCLLLFPRRSSLRAYQPSSPTFMRPKASIRGLVSRICSLKQPSNLYMVGSLICLEGR